MNVNPKTLPLSREGLPFVVGFFLSGSILLFIPYSLARFLGALFLILGFFCVFFFRDPEREISSDPSVVLSPGDGKILEVTEEPSPYWNGSAKVVKIFLSIFDVHVQRSPLAGD
ncbi:MAG: phosphatidylserine decarboxylase, partial [Elusimicrobia bacterium]|nr:phosphatidylserine decarboxylase [Elusimicrobiota bacterium]